MTSKKEKTILVSIALISLAVDQLIKYFIVKNIPEGHVGAAFFGDFLYICHERNRGLAFSLGAGSGDFVRILMFIIFPLVLIAFVSRMMLTDRFRMTRVQKVFAALVVGGGLGTLADRIFRFRTGVVDYISVKFYGLFGFQRWPTFNLSDSLVVVFVIALAISYIVAELGSAKSQETESGRKAS